jgi:hypothetical protein
MYQSESPPWTTDIHFKNMKGRKVKYVFLGVGASRRGVVIRKGGMRVKMVDVFCTHIGKQNYESCVSKKGVG